MIQRQIKGLFLFLLLPSFLMPSDQKTETNPSVTAAAQALVISRLPEDHPLRIKFEQFKRYKQLMNEGL